MQVYFTVNVGGKFWDLIGGVRPLNMGSECSNAWVLKSGCKRTQIAWKTKTFTIPAANETAIISKRCEGELINMTRAWDKEKFWVPDRNWTHDLPNTGRALYPLSDENSCSYVDIRLHVWFLSNPGSNAGSVLEVCLELEKWSQNTKILGKILLSSSV